MVYGRDDQLKLVADAWFSVFPDSRNENGGKVESIRCYGHRDFRQSSVTEIWSNDFFCSSCSMAVMM